VADVELDTERWLRIDRVLAEALERPPEERRTFATESLADDPALVDELLALLDADAGAGLFLRQTPGPLVADLVSSSWIGRHVGPYRLCEVIGYGGMGTVFRAERDDGEFRHQVAVKLLRGVGLSAEQRLRFQTERQILARLEHPNIARLYDGGTTADGSSYLVMELVDGLPIDSYCDRHRLSIEARLELFSRVCDAVRYAHQRLLVHRDLKPSNILVTGEGAPKLLDFGIAKQLDPSASAAVTTVGVARPMSLRYASPEQVLGEPTTTASDVYGLGVLLYELLSGQCPYRLQRGERGLARAICEQDPELPGAAVLHAAGDDPEAAEAAARRRGFPRPGALARRLHGDLDAIVLEAMRKSPGERYGSIEQLGEDLDRHRGRQPVRAHRGGPRYRAAKLVDRHRLAVTATALLLILGVVAIANHLWQSRRVARERDKAEAALTILTDAFAQADFSRGGGTVTARQVLDRGADRVEREMAGDPLVRSALLHAIGEAYSGIGEWDRARPLLEEALEIRRGSLGESHRDTATTRLVLGEVLREQTVWEPAEEMLTRAAADLEAALGDRHVDVAHALRELGRLHAQRGRLDRGETLLQRALEGLERELPPDHPETIRTLTYLGELRFARGDLEGSRRFHTRALEMMRRTYGEENPEVANGLGNLGSLSMAEGRWAEGEVLARRAVDMLRHTVNEEHPWIKIGLHNLGFAAHRQGHLEEAAERFREAVSLARSRLGNRHREVLVSLERLGLVLKEKGDLETAAAVLEESLDLSLEFRGDRHRGTGNILCHLGDVRRRQGRWDLAENLLRRCQDLVRGLGQEDHQGNSLPLELLGLLSMDTGHPEEAEPLLRRSFEIRRKLLGDDDWWTAINAAELGVCLAALGRDGEAEKLLLQSVAHLAAQLDPTDYRRVRAEAELAAFYAERPWLAPTQRSERRAVARGTMEPEPAEIRVTGDRQ